MSKVNPFHLADFAALRDCSVAHPTCHNFPMCGRYRLSRRKQVVEEYFDCVSDETDWSPRYNVAPAPTQPIPVIRQNPKEPVRELSLVRWGLIPSWAKDSSVAPKMINARSETAASKPAFRDALKFRRCLIPADGFYEWAKTAKAKQPYCFEVNEGGVVRVRGIVGSLERPEWQLDEDLLDPNYYPECRDRDHSRPNACDS